MKEQQLLERITLNPKIMAGKPVIKGTRLTVEYILGLLAQGVTPAEILEEYDGLTPEDLQACFLFATAEKLSNAVAVEYLEERAKRAKTAIPVQPVNA
jgi:uncharacterized protein (DUF433 family)